MTERIYTILEPKDLSTVKALAKLEQRSKAMMVAVLIREALKARGLA